MMNYLYTLDNDAGYIHENAIIEKIRSLKKVAEAFNKTQGVDDCKIIGWEIGSFGDCWIKSFSEPSKINRNIKCNVQPPGTHPGVNQYWITPIKEVYVPIWQTADERID